MLTKHSLAPHQPVQASDCKTSIANYRVFTEVHFTVLLTLKYAFVLFHQHQLELAFQLRILLINSPWCYDTYVYPIKSTWKTTAQATMFINVACADLKC